jgi:vanillate O-demethylase ferredoxin subunit
MESLNLVVTAIRAETPLIRALELARADGGVLPGWEAGAHVDLRLPSGDTRSYSLVNASSDPAATRQPTTYRLGVRLEAPSQGGSKFVHGLQVGDAVTVSAPENHFPLAHGGGEAVLLAGGIGITPILSMAASLAAADRPYRLIYAGRTRDHLAFLAEIEALAGPRLELHGDDVAGIFDVVGLMRSLPATSALYVCGPTPMIDAAIATAKELGWADSRLRFEIFTAPAPVAGDTAFEVVLKSSGKRVTVPPDKTILDALIEAGEDPLYDCKRGDCGVCQTGVIEGVPDHRDYYLSDGERASNKLIQICISRSKTPVLVLDL